MHVQVGTGSCYGEFSNPANQASSTWWIGVDGTLEQYVDADMTAWTEMAGNPYYDSVETEGTPDQPWTDAQQATLARLIAWGHQTFGWPLALVDHGGSGITTHAHYPSGVPDDAWGGHPCPGPVRTAQLPSVLAAAVAIVDPRPVSATAATVPAPPAVPQGRTMKAVLHSDTQQLLLLDDETVVPIKTPGTGAYLTQPAPQGLGLPYWGPIDDGTLAGFRRAAG